MRKIPKTIIIKDLPLTRSGETLPLPTMQRHTIVQQETGTEIWILHTTVVITITETITTQPTETTPWIQAETLLIPPAHGITAP